MSSVVRYAADIVRAFRDEARSIADPEQDERDMSKESLAALAAAFRCVETMTATQAKVIESSISGDEHPADEFARLVREYHEDPKGAGAGEAWNLIADFALEHSHEIVHGLRKSSYRGDTSGHRPVCGRQ